MGRLITGAGYTGTIGGNITVYGTPERQTITVADVAGTVTFDPSFNKGGDTIVLGKSAASYTIAQSGSTVVLSDGDSRIIIPVGTVANTVQFSDGDRTLLFSGGVKIGSQTVTTTAATITATGTTKSTLAADAATQAARLVLSEESASVGGNVMVYGTAGVESVSVVGKGKVTFDPSFNKGGDTVAFSDPASRFSATKAGSSVTLTNGQTSAVLPVGTVGLDVNFASDERSLKFANGAFLLGKDTLAASGATALSARTILSQSFERITSASVIDVNLNWEAINVADLNGDGKGDLVLANGPAGKSGEPIAETDLRTSIFLNDGSNKLVLADTSKLRPTGWVNDWVILPAATGNPYIVGIDHGREVAFDPKYFSKLEIFRFENGSFVDLSETPVGNSIAFYHNASSIGDLNNDGLPDFVSAKLSEGNFSIFYGDRTTIFNEVTVQVLGSNKFQTWGSNENVSNTGAALIIDIKNDGQNDFILLPFTHSTQYGGDFEGIYAEVFRFKDGAFETATRFNVKSGVDFSLSNSWGYSFAQVADLNNDGLQDFVALAENPDSDAPSGFRAFVTFIQKPDGSFDVSKAFTGEDVIADPKQSVQNYAGKNEIWSEYKFQLVDIDGDNILDLFWGSWFNGKPSDLLVSTFFGDGTGHFSRNEAKAAKIFEGISWDGTARTHMADFNGDGLGDLLVLQSVWTSSTSQTVTPVVFMNSVTFG